MIFKFSRAKYVTDHLANAAEGKSLKKLSDSIAASTKDITSQRKLIKFEIQAKSQKALRAKAQDLASAKGKVGMQKEDGRMLIPMKKLEIFQELKDQKRKSVNEYYGLMKKIELKPLSKENLVLKVQYLVSSTAYDAKIKKRSLQRKVAWATSELKKRKEEHRRTVLKLENAKTSELKAILEKIIESKKQEVSSAAKKLKDLGQKMAELSRRIGLLVQGELARKILEAKEKWLAQSDLMQERIDEYYSKIEKQKKLLDLNSWEYANLQNPEINKKFSRKAGLMQRIASNSKAINSTKSKLAKTKKTLESQIAKIKMMKARAVDAMKIKQDFKLLKKKESKNMSAVIKEVYKFDIEQQITTRKRCMSNLKKLIKKDMKSDVNRQLRRMNAYTNVKDVKNMIRTGTVGVKKANKTISDPRKLL